MVDAALLQVDWENAVKDKGKRLSREAAALREKTRRGMLQAFAPIMLLNDWAESDHELDGTARPVDVTPLPLMNPAAARGIIALRERGLPHNIVLTFAMDYGRIRATAKLTTATP